MQINDLFVFIDEWVAESKKEVLFKIVRNCIRYRRKYGIANDVFDLYTKADTLTENLTRSTVSPEGLQMILNLPDVQSYIKAKELQFEINELNTIESDCDETSVGSEITESVETHDESDNSDISDSTESSNSASEETDDVDSESEENMQNLLENMKSMIPSNNGIFFMLCVNITLSSIIAAKVFGS